MTSNNCYTKSAPYIIYSQIDIVWGDSIFNLIQINKILKIYIKTYE